MNLRLNDSDNLVSVSSLLTYYNARLNPSERFYLDHLMSLTSFTKVQKAEIKRIVADTVAKDSWA